MALRIAEFSACTFANSGTTSERCGALASGFAEINRRPEDHARCQARVRVKYLYLTSDFLGSWVLAAELLHQAPQHEMAALVVSRTPRGLKFVARLMQRSGLAYTARAALLSRGYKLIQAVGGLLLRALGREDALLSLERVAADYDVPILYTININTRDAVELLRGYHADLIVSVFFNQRLRTQVLNIPRLGSINLHNSVLPRYAGVDPSFHAIANSETCVGSSVHFMEEKFDSGAVIDQYRYARRPEDSVLHLDYIVMGEGIRIVAEALDRLQCGNVAATAQDPLARTYCSFPTKEEVQRFRRKGGRYFRWREVATLCFTGGARPSRREEVIRQAH